MKIAIIGAGAAGCFAAANIPFKKGLEVTIYEKTGKALQKVKASGGGRCNVTNAIEDVVDLSKHYPRGSNFLKKSFHHFGSKDTKAWFEKRGVLLKTESDGRVFPASNDAQTIMDCILKEMQRNETNLVFHKSVTKIESDPSGFSLIFTDNSQAFADKILVTTGGFSKPEHYQWLEDLGHTIEQPVPSLFTFNLPKNPITQLMGVSVSAVSVKIQGTKIQEQGALLITHWGFSGPAILRTSAWGATVLNDLNYGFKININWLGNVKDADLKEQIHYLRQEQGKQLLYQRNPFLLPKRLWEFLLQQAQIIDTTKWGALAATQQNKLVELLLRYEVAVNGKTTFKEEFVTCGGVKLTEINHNSMESKIRPNLFFAGEIMNVDGITGGFNFQHAWTSGWLAANALLED